MQQLISAIVPVLDEAHNVRPLSQAIANVLESRGPWEIIFVDDGSVDGTLQELRKLHEKDTRIRYLSFSRNFGHQSALRAGLEFSRGERIIMMDGDFQHPPELIPAMLDQAQKGYDIVQARRLDPKDPAARGGFVKRFGTKWFYRLMNSLGDVHIEPGWADFRLISARAKAVILSMPERNLFLRGAFPWTGLPTAEIPFEPGERRSGETKYGLSRMVALALEGVTSFSVRPLRITSFAGVLIALAGFLYAFYALAIRLFTDRTVEGWTSILASVLIIGGIQLCSLGIIGEYLGKLFLEAKARPEYVLKETSPFKPGEGGEA